MNQLSLRMRKIAKKKEEILQSALRLLAKKGYHGTTMEEIASHLLMTKGSLYYYFKDKQDLVFQSQLMILQQSIENIRIIKRKKISQTDKLALAISVHIEYAIREKSGFELMINPKQIFSAHQLEEILRLRDEYAVEYDALLTAGVKAGVKEGVFSANDIKVVRNLLLGAMNWVTQWYSSEGKMNEKEVASLITRYLMRIVLK